MTAQVTMPIKTAIAILFTDERIVKLPSTVSANEVPIISAMPTTISKKISKKFQKVFPLNIPFLIEVVLHKSIACVQFQI